MLDGPQLLAQRGLHRRCLCVRQALDRGQLRCTCLRRDACVSQVDTPKECFLPLVGRARDEGWRSVPHLPCGRLGKSSLPPHAAHLHATWRRASSRGAVRVAQQYHPAPRREQPWARGLVQCKRQLYLALALRSCARRRLSERAVHIRELFLHRWQRSAGVSRWCFLRHDAAS